MSKAVLLLILLLVVPLRPEVWAQAEPAQDAEPAEPSQPAVAPSAPSIGLDSLLRPRAGTVEPTPTPRVGSALPGGRSEDEWRLEFSDAQLQVEVLQERVRETQQKIRESSTGEWGYTPTGSGMPSDPEVLKLRAEIKRDRQSLEAAQTRLRDLDVEASLLGVPDPWREPLADPN